MRNVPRGRTRYPDKVDDYSWDLLSSISDCVHWFDASNMYTSRPDGEAVRIWDSLIYPTDDSLFIIQNTAASQPLYKEKVINGRDALLFDGSNDFFALSPSVLTTNDYTLIFVIKLLSVASMCVPFRDSASGDGTGIIGYTSNNTSFYRMNGTEMGLNTNLSDEIGTQTRIFTFHKSGTTGTIYRDSVSRVSATINATSNLSTLVFGRNGSYNEHYTNEYLCEILLYNRALTAAEIVSIHLYLKNKWGI